MELRPTEIIDWFQGLIVGIRAGPELEVILVLQIFALQAFAQGLPLL